MNQQTLISVIVRELNKLSALSLSFAPRPEMIQKTAEVWIETLSTEFTQRDEVEIRRIQFAFSELRKKSDKWPSPAMFVSCLPPYKKQYEIAGPPPTEEECQTGQAAIKNIIQMLSGEKSV